MQGTCHVEHSELPHAQGRGCDLLPSGLGEQPARIAHAVDVRRAGADCGGSLDGVATLKVDSAAPAAGADTDTAGAMAAD